MNARKNADVAESSVGIMMHPNHPMYRRFRVEVTQAQNFSQKEGPSLLSLSLFFLLSLPSLLLLTLLVLFFLHVLGFVFIFSFVFSLSSFFCGDMLFVMVYRVERSTRDLVLLMLGLL